MKFLILIIILIAINKSIEKSKNEKYYKIPNYFKIESKQKEKNNFKKNNKITNTSTNEMPYQKRKILTDTEQKFYEQLKIITDKENMIICPKVRLEDIIETTSIKQKQKYRGYIKSRHIDFVICDKNMNTLGAIELDDDSHHSEKAKTIDNFKNELFKTVGIRLIRVYRKSDYTIIAPRVIQEIKYGKFL